MSKTPHILVADDEPVDVLKDAKRLLARDDLHAELRERHGIETIYQTLALADNVDAAANERPEVARVEQLDAHVRVELAQPAEEVGLLRAGFAGPGNGAPPRVTLTTGVPTLNPGGSLAGFTIRGGQLALGREGRVFVVWNGAAGA